MKAAEAAFFYIIREMAEEFLTEDDEEEIKIPEIKGSKNYMTPACYHRLLDERQKLVKVERPEVVQVVSWAASNGDRSENGDYLYGKKRLREIDRRIRKTVKLLIQLLVRPLTKFFSEQLFFSAMKKETNQKSELWGLTKQMLLLEMFLGSHLLLEFS